MSKNSESDLGMPYVLIFSPGKDQFAILYFVDDPESSGDSLVCRITPGPNIHTHTPGYVTLRGHILEICKLFLGTSRID